MRRRLTVSGHFAFCLGFVFSPFFIPICSAQIESVLRVKADGFADAVLPGADGLALEDGKRRAIEAAVRGLAPAQFDFVASQIVENRERYILSAAVAGRDTIEGQRVVTVELKLRGDRLRDDLALRLLHYLPHPPRVLVLGAGGMEGAPERTVRGAERGRAALEQELSTRGLTVVGRDGSFSDRAITSAVMGRTQRVAEIGATLGADLVLAVSSVNRFTPPPKGLNLAAHHAKISYRLVYVRSGLKVAEGTSEARVQSADERLGAGQALEDACVKIAGRIFTESVFAGLSRGEDLGLVVSFRDPGTRETFEPVLAALRRAIGGLDLMERSYSVEQADVTAAYTGPLGPVVEALTEGRFSGVRVELEVAAGRELQFRVVGD